MSGHSKWSTIKHQKEAQDKKRGQIFSKLSRAITVAAREGGVDPETNFKLRLEIEKAKAANMPKNNIERAIERGGGGDGEGARLESVTYEGYAPGGIAMMVQVLTDNRNRTGAEVKHLIERGGGSLAEPGAVSYQFEPMGFLTVEKQADPEAQILTMIDLGVEEVDQVGNLIEVFTPAVALAKARGELEGAGFKVKSAELVQRPKTSIKIDDPQKATKVLKLVTELEEHEDVQEVSANFEIPESDQIN